MPLTCRLTAPLAWLWGDKTRAKNDPPGDLIGLPAAQSAFASRGVAIGRSIWPIPYGDCCKNQTKPNKICGLKFI